MLQVRVNGPHDVRVDDVAPPSPGPLDAVVRIAACGICGSDLSTIKMGGMAGPGPEPLCLGHEVSGTVDWVGAEVSRFRVTRFWVEILWRKNSASARMSSRRSRNGRSSTAPAAMRW